MWDFYGFKFSNQCFKTVFLIHWSILEKKNVYLIHICSNANNVYLYLKKLIILKDFLHHLTPQLNFLKKLAFLIIRIYESGGSESMYSLGGASQPALNWNRFLADLSHCSNSLNSDTRCIFLNTHLIFLVNRFNKFTEIYRVDFQSW